MYLPFCTRDIFKFLNLKGKKYNYPLAEPNWLTLTCTETRWGWLPVKVDIVSLCVSLSAVISCVTGAAPSHKRQSISQHQTQVAEARESGVGTKYVTNNGSD